MFKDLKTAISFGVVAIILTLAGVFCIEKQVEEPYEKRIGALESQISVIEKSLATPKFVEETAKLKLEVEQMKLEMKKSEEGLRSDYNLFFTIGIPLTILGLIAFMWGLYSTIFTAAVKDAKKEVARQLNSEETIKLEKSIVILSKSGADNSFLERFFKRMGFGNFRTMDYSANDDAFLNYDAVVLNNDFQETEAIYFTPTERAAIFEKVKSTQRVIFFYFGGADLATNIRSHQQCASTNLKPQLYGNLINALKFQKML